MGCPRFDECCEYRWPLLCWICRGGVDPCLLSARSPRKSSPTSNPGNVAAKAMANIDRSLTHGQLRGSCPKLTLVAVTNWVRIRLLLPWCYGYDACHLFGQGCWLGLLTQDPGEEPHPLPLFLVIVGQALKTAVHSP